MKSIEIPDYITVRELATLMSISPINIIKQLMKSGIMANINQQIDFDTAAIVAEEMGFEPVGIKQETADDGDEGRNLPAWRNIIANERNKDLVVRPPVVTILGHVDHGKTSLLDAIRKENVAAGESGGITQHIGAYQATHNNRVITFLDTPGHQAFTAMRARGAQATDIAVLVVAADDGLMPQTREAIDHAKAANVPIVVALNKVDLPGANRAKALQQLADVGLTPDEWGGNTMVIPVSAKMRQGLDDLLEAILLTADELEPRANPKAKEVVGVVLEAKMERGRGALTTLLVQNGTLNVGQTILIGNYYGKIKSMQDFRGKSLKSATPSMPVSVSGLNGIPSAGAQFRVVKDEKEARAILDALAANVEEVVRPAGPSLEEFFKRLELGESKTLLLILKVDVQGSLDPILSTLTKMSNDEVEVKVLRSATGNITENDVMLASASGAVIIGFNVSADTAAQKAAASEEVDIRTYEIIYQLFDDIEKAVKGMLAPVYELQITGRAEVRALFNIKSQGMIAGCYMRTGTGYRNAVVRIIRDGKLLHEGPVSSLRHHAESIKEIKQGFEFGMTVQGWEAWKENDIIEFFQRKRVNI